MRDTKDDDVVEYKKGGWMKKTASWRTGIGVIMLSGKVYQNDATTNKFSDGREKTVKNASLVKLISTGLSRARICL